MVGDCGIAVGITSDGAAAVACKFLPMAGGTGGEALFFARMARNTTPQHRHSPTPATAHIQRKRDFLFEGWLPDPVAVTGGTGADSVSAVGAGGMVIGAEGWEVCGGIVTASDAASGIETAIVEALVAQACLNASTKAGTSA